MVVVTAVVLVGGGRGSVGEERAGVEDGLEEMPEEVEKGKDDFSF